MTQKNHCKVHINKKIEVKRIGFTNFVFAMYEDEYYYLLPKHCIN